MWSYNDFIAGGFSGIVEVSATHWIDNIKTRTQDNQIQGKGKLHWQSLTFSQMYRGYIPRVIGIVPMRFVFWGSQGISNHYCQNMNTNVIIQLMTAGGISGFVQSTIDNPIEVMKVRLMTSTKTTNKFWNVNWYRGFVPTASRNVTFASIFNVCVRYKNTDSHLSRFVQGAGAGIIAGAVSHPFDVAKTAMQRHGSTEISMWRFMLRTIKHNPLHLFSGGLSRCVLSCTTMSVGYVSLRFITDVIL